LIRIVGPARAKELIYSGKIMTAAVAAVKNSKMLINKGMDADFGTGQQFIVGHYVLRMKTNKNNVFFE
jgi:hypothetical protein